MLAMRYHGWTSSSLILLTLISALLVGPLYAQQPSGNRARIVHAVDDRTVVRLPNTTHGQIRLNPDRGRVPADLPMNRIVMTLKSSPEQEAELEQLLADQQNPASPRFHQWLTPEQFGERFGASLEDIGVITQWLRGHGFSVDKVGNGRRQIEFSGTLRQVEEAFHTEIHNYESNGVRHIANATDISIPQALTPAVQGLVSLHDFLLPSKISRIVKREQALDSLDPDDNFTSGRHGLAPYDFATIYDVVPLWNEGIDGTGQSIAIVGRTNINLSDIATFRSKYGLPPNPPQIVLTGPDPGIVSPDEEGEADLDVTWSGAVAKGAAIKLVVSGQTNSTDGVVLSALYIVDQNVAPILSMSFGACEAESVSAAQFWSSLWQQGAAQGISVFASAGDSGAADCDSASSLAAAGGLSVDSVASTPYNVSVGGSQFNENGADSTYWNAANSSTFQSAKSYIPEVVWNESGSTGLWSGGGGVSMVFPTPNWQTGPGVPASDPGASGQHHRYVPDVSLSAAAHDGYVLIQDGLLELVGGTSVSSPAFAGIMALVNQSVNSANGNPNPGIYTLAAKNPAVFHDITSGTNGVPCAVGSPNCSTGSLPGFAAGPGYDLATGWGSVDASLFVHAWAGTGGVGVTLGPAVTITSHTSGQTVFTGTITLSGTASDAGRGGNGIFSVTVNGVRASGDTAVGSATANWSRSLALTTGSNVITVVATDNSSKENSTTLSITIVLAPSTGNGTGTSVTANTYHLFPQVADGRLGDGAYYRTTLMISNPSPSTGATCALQFHGVSLPGFATNYTMGGGGFVIAQTPGSGRFQSGYAALQCSAKVEAQMLYSFYSPGGVKLSEATVFSSPPSSAALVIADQTAGGQLGVAIANDSDQAVNYTVIGGDFEGPVLHLGPRSSVAKLASELVPNMDPNALSYIEVLSSVGKAGVIGLRFTGNVFTTIPAIQLSPTGATANTYHVFPEFADGKFSDGAYYRTTRMYLNPVPLASPTCTTRLRGLTTDGKSTLTGNLTGLDFAVVPTNGTQAFQAGYATMECTGVVEAQALYSLYSPDGVKLSEATVFSSPAAPAVQILADFRDGAQVGLAIANDTDQINTYTITVYDADGKTVGSATQQLAARSSVAKFVSELVLLPPNYYGPVVVSSGTGPVSVIGLRFTGSIFTTIPQTIRSTN
jgi:pseudomonalisin